MSKYVLGINTVSNPIEVCIVNKTSNFCENVLWEKNKNESKEVLFRIEKLLSDNKVNLSNIENVIVVNGEGGYTGTRIGVSVANIFAYVGDLKLSSLLVEDLSGKSLMDYIKNLDLSSLEDCKIIYPKYARPARISN